MHRLSHVKIRRMCMLLLALSRSVEVKHLILRSGSSPNEILEKIEPNTALPEQRLEFKSAGYEGIVESAL